MFKIELYAHILTIMTKRSKESAIIKHNSIIDTPNGNNHDSTIEHGTSIHINSQQVISILSSIINNEHINQSVVNVCDAGSGTAAMCHMHNVWV